MDRATSPRPPTTALFQVPDILAVRGAVAGIDDAVLSGVAAMVPRDAEPFVRDGAVRGLTLAGAAVLLRKRRSGFARPMCGAATSSSRLWIGHISSAAARPPEGPTRRSDAERTMRREAAAAWATQCWPAEVGGGRSWMRRRGASAASSRDRLAHAAYDRLREHGADARAARGRPDGWRHA